MAISGPVGIYSVIISSGTGYGFFSLIRMRQTPRILWQL